MRDLLFVLPLALAACEEPAACTEEAAAAVNVTVVDDLGDALSTAEVVYSVGQAAPIACDNVGAGAYACAYEVEGEITVSATAEGGFAPDEATVTVALDEEGCHVVPQAVTLVLQAIDG
ncbi:MAG: hypothetical protein JXX28_03540 [Deltaproteobacteria bacterium]|nr:hypothetical protein [Deltaproteobacteria bacterium]